MHRVNFCELRIDDYESVVGPDVIAELKDLSRALQDKRILNINATPVGRGVAEILKSEIPLLRSLGSRHPCSRSRHAQPIGTDL